MCPGFTTVKHGGGRVHPSGAWFTPVVPGTPWWNPCSPWWHHRQQWGKVGQHQGELGQSLVHCCQICPFALVHPSGVMVHAGAVPVHPDAFPFNTHSLRRIIRVSRFVLVLLQLSPFLTFSPVHPGCIKHYYTTVKVPLFTWFFPVCHSSATFLSWFVTVHPVFSWFVKLGLTQDVENIALSVTARQTGIYAKSCILQSYIKSMCTAISETMIMFTV